MRDSLFYSFSNLCGVVRGKVVIIVQYITSRGQNDMYRALYRISGCIAWYTWLYREFLTYRVIYCIVRGFFLEPFLAKRRKKKTLNKIGERDGTLPKRGKAITKRRLPLERVEESDRLFFGPFSYCDLWRNLIYHRYKEDFKEDEDSEAAVALALAWVWGWR